MKENYDPKLPANNKRIDPIIACRCTGISSVKLDRSWRNLQNTLMPVLNGMPISIFLHVVVDMLNMGENLCAFHFKFTENFF